MVFAGDGAQAQSQGVPGVIAAMVEEKQFSDKAETIGTTVAFESVEITTTVSDRIVDIRFEDGAEVKRGQVLVVLESDEERARLSSAEALLAERKSAYARARKLISSEFISEAALEERRALMQQAEADVAMIRAQLEDRVIRAPFDGVTGLRNVSQGALVAPGDVITTLDDINPIKLDITVPSAFLSGLKEGADVAATSAAFPAETFEGTVRTVSTRIDPETRAITVRALIPNDDGRLKPGLAMTVDLVKNERRALVIPEEAIVPELDRSFVFVVTDARKVERREVVIGARRPGDVEVRQGLEAGELVVTHGVQKVRPGEEVKIIAVDRGDLPLTSLLEEGGDKESATP